MQTHLTHHPIPRTHRGVSLVLAAAVTWSMLGGIHLLAAKEAGAADAARWARAAACPRA